MRTYELLVVVKPSLKEADRKKLMETIAGWLGDVKVTKENDMGQKPLAYVIKKENAGHYTQLFLETEGTIPADFENRLLRSADILRHLVLRTK